MPARLVLIRWRLRAFVYDYEQYADYQKQACSLRLHLPAARGASRIFVNMNLLAYIANTSFFRVLFIIIRFIRSDELVLYLCTPETKMNK